MESKAGIFVVAQVATKKTADEISTGHFPRTNQTAGTLKISENPSTWGKKNTFEYQLGIQSPNVRG